MPISPEDRAVQKKRWYELNKPRQQELGRLREKNKRLRRKNLIKSNCFCCGDPDYSVIQWHHVDESQKLFELFGATVAEDKWWTEVLKCIPLCANCHIKIHKNLLCLIPPKLR